MKYIKSFIIILIKSIMKVLLGRPQDAILYYPVFNDFAELAHHYHAAKYFLPLDDECKVMFLVNDSLKSIIEKKGGIPLPDYFDDNLGCDRYEPDIIFCKTDIGILRMLKFKPSSILLWKSVPKIKHKPWSLVLNQTALIVDVDRYATWDCYSYPILRCLLAEKDKIIGYRVIAQKRFVDYEKNLLPYTRAYVFGTGPSVETAYNYDFSDGYRIICNTLVKNDSLMEHIKPHFIVAADGIYHFGISKYAASFRRDLERTIRKHSCMLLMPETYYENFIFHYPHLKESIITVSYERKSINIDMIKDLSIKPMGNVLTQLLLPLGSSLANDIRFLGFDGRKPDDKHFWSSSNAVNYEDLKIFQQQAHPGLFKGVNFEQYAKDQSEQAEEIISHGESLGKCYYSLNESTNSALAKRFLKAQEG
jgi:hypothetical protein